MTTVNVFVPTGRRHRAAAADWHRSPIGAIRQATVGIVDNTKPNARALMSGVAERLIEAGLISKVSMKRKGGPSEGVSEAGFGDLEQEASVVLVGSAD